MTARSPKDKNDPPAKGRSNGSPSLNPQTSTYTTGKDRLASFPAIEKRYGEPINYWLKLLNLQPEQDYKTLFNYLTLNYGISKTHANTLVMYSKGSTTTSKFSDLPSYLDSLQPQAANTINQVLNFILTLTPKATLTLAWNKPMIALDQNYIFGAYASRDHLSFSPWSSSILTNLDYPASIIDVKVKTFTTPLDWKLGRQEQAFLRKIISARIKEL